jgi:glycosyltransferase involved in cell wall biosynthesis
MLIHYNFATRNRPQKMAEAISTITDLSTDNNYTIALTIDDDDSTTLNSQQLAVILQSDQIKINPGRSGSKVHAINRGMAGWSGDIVVNMSDDMRFIKRGFDGDIIQAFQGDRDQFIHFPDGRMNGVLPTMSIMGRSYYERFNFIYHPDYYSLWCDNEAMDVAQQLGRYKYIDLQIFSHEHPAWTGEPADALLMHTESFFEIDQETYQRRSKLGFPI